MSDKKIFFAVLFVPLFFTTCFILSFISGITVYTQILIKIRVCFENKKCKEVLVAPARPEKIRAIFTSFKKIKWVDPDDGKIYEAPLPICAFDGWYDASIRKGLLIVHGASESGVDLIVHPRCFGTLEENAELAEC